MNQIAESISEFLSSFDRIIPLENLYFYPFDETRLPIGINFRERSNSFRRNIELKNSLHRAWLNGNNHTKENIIKYYIKDWGGIKSNSEHTMNRYCNETEGELLARSINNGVSSWSKALVIHNPEIYFIYDSRVAISINCLQILTRNDQKLKFFMPFPNGRPNRSINTIRSFLTRENYYNYDNWINIDLQEQYNYYLQLLSLIENYSGFDKSLIEMSLFELTEILAAQLLNNR